MVMAQRLPELQEHSDIALRRWDFVIAGIFWVSVQGQELDSKIFVGFFQFRVFHSSVILWDEPVHTWKHSGTSQEATSKRLLQQWELIFRTALGQ